MSMNPGFIPSEAIDLIRLNYIASALDPQDLEPTPEDRGNPLSNKDIPATTTFASPIQPIWPVSWGPVRHHVWKQCVVCSVFPAPKKSDQQSALLKRLFNVGNTALVAYNQATDQYALVFAGTENVYGALEDLAFIPISTGEVDKASLLKTLQPVFKAMDADADQPDVLVAFLASILAGSYRYVPESYSRSEVAQIDLGFRLAFESLSSKVTNATLLSKTPSLIDALDLIPDGSDLFISGHSLGGAMATVATAWFLAGNYSKRFNIKTYTFAAPKSGNEYYANYLNGALANQGLFYRVYNDLDSVPQVPYTLEMPGEINNPNMLKSFTSLIHDVDVQSKIKDILVKVLPDGWSLNYTHAGLPHVLAGQPPIIHEEDKTQTTWPDKYFLGHDLPLPHFGSTDLNPTPEQDAQAIDRLNQWWQHMPWTYLDLLLNSP